MTAEGAHADDGGALRTSARRAAAYGRALVAVALRTTEALIVLLALSSLVFLALRLLPGDPAALVLGDHASDDDRAVLRAKLGLDRSLLAQYATFVAGALRLDLGQSLARPGRTAFAEVASALSPTASLAGLAVAMGAILGIGLALLSVGPWLGRRKEWVHGAILAVAATPLVAFAPIATFFLAVRARLVPLPGDPDSGVGGVMFAAGLLSLPLAAQVARIGRAALLDQSRAKYLEVAAAKGATPLRVWFVHALPVASGPIAVVVATQLGALLGGAVVLERLFERPGLGSLMLSAYAARDLPVLEAAVMASGALFVLAQTVSAAVTSLVDPRGAAP